MKKALLLFITAALLLICLPAGALAEGETYYYDAALAYARLHWNDYKGGCIVFVTDSFKAAGIKLPQFSQVSRLKEYLVKNGYGEIYVLETVDIDVEGILKGKAVPCSAENEKIAVPGDLMFWYCSKCKTYNHVGIIGADREGYLSMYAHNLAENNKRPASANCIRHGVGAFVEVHALHMNNATTKQEVEQVKEQAGTVRLLLGKGEKVSLLTEYKDMPFAPVHTSSDNAVVTVDRKGAAKANGAGNAMVMGTTSDGRVLYNIAVTVEAAPTKILFKQAAVTVQKGKNIQLKSVMDGASYKTTFTSENPYIARVDKITGLVEAVRTGKTVITVQTFNLKTARCTVEVVEYAPPGAAQ